jgi:hypothetical protein
MVMGTGRRRRGSWHRAKSRRKLEKTASDPGCKARSPDGVIHQDEPDRLLLSALNYWEVERDLIEERLATRSATAAS